MNGDLDAGRGVVDHSGASRTFHEVFRLDDTGYAVRNSDGRREVPAML
jgi:hypothetical protein